MLLERSIGMSNFSSNELIPLTHWSSITGQGKKDSVWIKIMVETRKGSKILREWERFTIWIHYSISLIASNGKQGLKDEELVTKRKASVRILSFNKKSLILTRIIDLCLLHLQKSQFKEMIMVQTRVKSLKCLDHENDCLEA